MSANLQFVDSFYLAVSIGIGGALISLAETLQWGISAGVLIVLVLQLLFVLLSFLASLRITELVHQEHHPISHAKESLPI